jgi:hypothetical protein
MIHDGVSIYLALRLTRTPTGDMASLHLPPYKEDDNGRNDTRVKQCQAEEHLRATGPRETLADGEKFLILDIPRECRPPVSQTGSMAHHALLGR